jgi:hypothetical protein
MGIRRAFAETFAVQSPVDIFVVTAIVAISSEKSLPSFQPFMAWKTAF